jgi:hypothetical protein
MNAKFKRGRGFPERLLVSSNGFPDRFFADRYLSVSPYRPMTS